MGRLLTALRRIEARNGTAEIMAAEGTIAPQIEDDLVGEIASSAQASPTWPGEIDYDPQAEYPGLWGAEAVGEWHLPDYSDQYDKASVNAIHGEASYPTEVDCESSEDTEAVVRTNDSFVADTAPDVWQAETAEVEEFAETPSIPATTEYAEISATTVLAELPSAETPNAEVTEEHKLVSEAATHKSAASEKVTPESPTPPLLKSAISKPLTPPPHQEKDAASECRQTKLSLVQAIAPEVPADEPVVSVRLPGFGRPLRRGRATAQDAAAEGNRQPASVPFLPSTQRPYRAACESILSALPQESSVALVLAWVDNDLDHCVLSARLAEVMADRLDDPVLVIDMGPKRRLSTLLRAPAMGSLTDAMVGFVSWRDQIVQTDTAGLCLLPSEPHDFDADPVAVARLIEACKEDFALVLIVGGAVSEVPENVLTACDMAVLLVESAHTSAATATGTIQRLRRSGTELVGCLLTGAAG